MYFLCVLYACFVLLAVPEIWAADSLTSPLPSKEAIDLQKAIEVALHQSPVLKSAQADEEVAQAAFEGAKAALWPKIDLNASYFKENQPIPYIPAQAIDIPAKFSDEIYAWSIFLRLPIYEGGRLVGQVQVSRIERSSQAFLRQMTLNDLVANVTNTFYKCLQLKQLISAYELSVSAMKQQRKDMEVRFKLGRIAQVELLRMDVQLAAEERRLVAAQEGLKRSRNALAFFMGINSYELPDLRGEINANEGILQVDITTLVQSRPDVVAIKHRVQAERERLNVVKAKRYPSISLVSDYGNRAGAGLSNREEVWEAGVTASLNIFDGGVISSELAKQQAAVAKAEETLRLLELRAQKEIEDAISALNEAKERLKLAETSVLQAKEALRIEELRYKTGSTNITDFLLSQSAMSLAEADRLQALYDYNAALTEFKRATGAISGNSLVSLATSFRE
ncbi:MAG: TolC family protein [Dissulfuribacterales bacterium]